MPFPTRQTSHAYLVRDYAFHPRLADKTHYTKLSEQETTVADRWLIEYGTSKDNMTMVGKAGTRADAAATAQRHLDSRPSEPGVERIVFPPDNPAGEYCCAGGFYRITRLGTGQWKAVP